MSGTFEARAVWRGGPDGSGETHVGEHASVVTYNPGNAGADKSGANPETLLAGALATCFSITLGYMAKRYGYEEAHVTATATMGKGDDGRERVLGLALAVQLRPEIPPDTRVEVLAKAEKGCTIARSIRAAIPITIAP